MRGSWVGSWAVDRHRRAGEDIFSLKLCVWLVMQRTVYMTQSPGLELHEHGPGLEIPRIRYTAPKSNNH